MNWLSLMVCLLGVAFCGRVAYVEYPNGEYSGWAVATIWASAAVFHAVADFAP